MSATVQDPLGQVFANGSYQFTLWTPSGFSPSQCIWGAGPPPFLISGQLDATGSFTASIPDNNTITPSGTMWQITVQPFSTSPSSETLVFVTGASQNISSQINAVLPPIMIGVAPSPSAIALGRAYNNNEVTQPIAGTIYFNLSNRQLQYFDGTTWTGLGTGGGPTGGTIAIPSSNMFGQPQPGQIVLLYTAAQPITFPPNFANPASYGTAGANPTSTETYTVQSGGSAVGTVSISTTGTFTFTTAGFVVPAGGRLTMTAPPTMDLTLSDVAITLVGTT